MITVNVLALKAGDQPTPKQAAAALHFVANRMAGCETTAGAVNTDYDDLPSDDVVVHVEQR